METKDWQQQRINAAAVELADFHPSNDPDDREVRAQADRALAGADSAVPMVTRAQAEADMRVMEKNYFYMLGERDRLRALLVEVAPILDRDVKMSMINRYGNVREIADLLDRIKQEIGGEDAGL